jgi:hypothetical protein
MSISSRKSFEGSVIIPNDDEPKQSIFLTQTNSINLFLAEVLHRGVISGEINFSNVQTSSLIEAINKNSCIISHIYGNNLIKSANNEKANTTSTSYEVGVRSSVPSSVHILDVTVDDGKAHELSACHRVSGIAENCNDDPSTFLSENGSISTISCRKRPPISEHHSNKKNAFNNRDTLCHDSLQLSTIERISSYVSEPDNLPPAVVMSRLIDYKNAGMFSLTLSA